MYLFFVLGMILCSIGIFGTQDVRAIEETSGEKTSMKDVLFNKKLFYSILLLFVFFMELPM